MNQAIVVHLTSTENTMIASARIARFVKSKLKTCGALLIDDKEKARTFLAKPPNKNFDLFVVNGPPAFCSFREEIAEMVKRCRRWIWIQNDYTIYPPSQVNKVARERGWVNDKGHIQPQAYWTTIPARVTRPQDRYINWNALTFQPNQGAREGRRNGFIYYGAFRGNREERFIQYLPHDAIISAPSRAQKRFAEIGFFTFVPPMEHLLTDLRKYQATAFIQDERSDKKFMSLPNRFYECLTAELCQFVSAESVPSLETAGYTVDLKWVVEDHSEISARMRNARRIANAQSEAWYRIAEQDHNHLRANSIRQAMGKLNDYVKC